MCARPVPTTQHQMRPSCAVLPGMALDTARISTLTRELTVLDAQRRGLVAELRRLAGRRVNAGSVTDRVLGYLRRVGGPATTTELLDFIVSERPRLNRRACAVSLYLAARRGRGWVLPESVVISRDEGDE